MALTWAEFEARGLTEPEKKLVKACREGEECELGDGERPEGPDDARTIRADLLRFLILGGGDGCRVHECGVRLVGAWVSGELDLSFATAKGETLLFQCRFEKAIEALQTRFEVLNLTGSAVPGMNAQGAKVTGDMFLRNKFMSEGQVCLSGAEIGGQLSCEGGMFCNPRGRAILAQRLKVVEGLYWGKIDKSIGLVDLNAAHVGDLVDDLASWPDGEGRLYLDGFTYDRIAAAPTDAKTRLEWLRRGTVWEGEFLPQPYTHLAKVLRGMGHERAARVVMIERTKLVGQYARARFAKPPEHS